LLLVAEEVVVMVIVDQPVLVVAHRVLMVPLAVVGEDLVQHNLL